LATASASYWTIHYDEWKSQFCDEESSQRDGSQGVREVDPCDDQVDFGSAMDSRRSGEWDIIKGFALADVNGYVTIGTEIYRGYKNVRSNWAQVGRYINGASGLVRLTYPSTTQMVIMGAKSIGRHSIIGLVGTALMDSAINSWQ
jgi:hypothetical protein